MCWALMAEQTTKTTSKLMCSPSNVFRSYMADLMVVIQDADIPIVAMGLYSNKIISENTRDKARISHRTKLEKNEDLLTAVEAVVSVQPQALDTFLNILNKIESASVDNIVQEMRSKLSHSAPLEWYCKTCNQLFCHYCSITNHDEHEYGSVTDMIHKQMEEAEREFPAIQQQVPILNSAQQAMEEKLSQISLQENEVEKQIRAVTQQAIKSLQESEKKAIELLKLEVNRKSTILSEQIKEVASDRRQLEEFQKLLKEEMTAEAMTEMQQKLELVRSVIKSTSSLQPKEEDNIKFTAENSLLSCCCKFGDVYATDVASKVQATGKGKEFAVAQETTTFELESSTSLPLPLSVLSCHVTTPIDSCLPVECAITRNKKQGCNISYTPTVRGLHQVQITIEGKEIPTSPFSVLVYPSPQLRGRPVKFTSGLACPRGIAVINETKEVVVSEESTHQIHVFNKDGEKVKSFGSEGHDESHFVYPNDVAVTRDNNLLIVDKQNNRIQQFTSDGKFIKSTGKYGVEQQPLEFLYPHGIAVHPSTGQVFVVEIDNGNVQVLNNDLTFSHRIGMGYLHTPVDVALDSHGQVYVTDCLKSHVQVFNSSSKYVSSIEKGGRWRPSGIAIDLMDMVYVSDTISAVSVFNPSGQCIKCFGEEERLGAVHKVLLVGITIDSSGNLFVCNRKGSIFVY